jgi:hypothetical protein
MSHFFGHFFWAVTMSRNLQSGPMKWAQHTFTTPKYPEMIGLYLRTLCGP